MTVSRTRNKICLGADMEDARLVEGCVTCKPGSQELSRHEHSPGGPQSSLYQHVPPQQRIETHISPHFNIGNLSVNSQVGREASSILGGTCRENC
jgi:hypothetical protein